ncbi:uncharacterized protein At2g39795, mitochondrial-like [Prosopis cineraria]|uniref:uncharacterized protein At2g39795, mitochondrial-like n=1 Tax=Prosopis cineraria TaxID=364024 RepID=UPI0024102C1C|nr:uncharacterized protein At2g39795, mitochondrial-like [Prosopis cineraria]
MARLLQIAQRKLDASLPSIRSRTHEVSGCVHSLNVTSTCLHQTRRYGAQATPKSLFESNILRILRNEIEFQSEYAPPEQPMTKFNSFTVQDRPGEQWITMKGSFGDKEEIKIEATMFDGYAQVPKLGDDSSGVNVHLHFSLLVDISKEEFGSELEFVCSAWPESLEIQRVYILRRDRMHAMPYMGPDFRTLDTEIQEKFREYLKTRGINNELCIFLHQYMTNKHRIELLRYLRNVKSFVEK